ncbi:hypothetical protein AGABI1DRAFT_79511 [Agaricus bisporus var. burnettii JB137-S8]|uniref:Mitochondrial glycine transporter n=1 Tax=Agaricus bisporus var. burnettii (strain JB137-S8 / ATCC MYA-4627 / FGSC 10392) TaxID=597362 RepID=K5WYQ9_AGABU|nr:hypothetical protein AGABI2DRAFT_202216 [Agaricus bisporus var. bisporus H97]XP_007333652.1 uncharacterized protein AGABI1DRAFT_79511 [Agaricus bisporus var. burnettii JB137-S8]EKM75747.1 hypothetical protein AGABI1DRAFT_79511 [Agaricus bisporus var. burnettii JB137-S8]EKV47942.1 hypothetical protein AGABI2DRAFT_202216 [Agaricus bisporus var. bisporus H97]
MSNVTNQMFSGALSGFATTTFLQPFDLLKTRMQQGDGRIRSNRGVSLVTGTLQDVLATRGWKGLWRGTEASLMRNVPGVAMYMTCLTQLRTWMATSPYFTSYRQQPFPDNPNASVLPKLTNTGNLLAGATTRVAVGLLLNPFSVLKARYESDMYAYKSLGGALSSIAKQGPQELLRGFMASALRDAPYAGLFVVFYEGIKREAMYLTPPTSTSHSTLVHGISAATAGAMATMVTQPFDVIKTKIQVRREDRYHGFFKTVGTIWNQRGISGYFDGASLRMSRKVLSSALGWAVYEGFLMFVRASNRQVEHS